RSSSGHCVASISRSSSRSTGSSSARIAVAALMGKVEGEDIRLFVVVANRQSRVVAVKGGQPFAQPRELGRGVGRRGARHAARGDLDAQAAVGNARGETQRA